MNLILNFYKFTKIDSIEEFRLDQLRKATMLGLKGTILIAPEGINAMLSGEEVHLKSYLQQLQEDERFLDVKLMWTAGQTNPFRKLKAKIKDYIVVFDPEFKVKFEEINSAPHLDAESWRDFLKNKPEDVVILDTRNYYEYDYGTFEGAEHLGIKNFRQFPKKFLDTYKDDKDKTFLMFCTGGIRCEKAAVFAKNQGFEKVYQLDGGILKYFEKFGGDAYQGSCFVFDYRWAVNPNLNQSNDGPHPDQLDRVPNLA